MVTRRILPRGEKYDPTQYPPTYAASNQTLLTDYSVSVDPLSGELTNLENVGRIKFKNSTVAERFKAISSSVGTMRFLRALAQKDLLETTQRIFSDSDLNNVAQTLRIPESKNLSLRLFSAFQIAEVLQRPS